MTVIQGSSRGSLPLGCRVLCRKCGYANPVDVETCEYCGHGLYVRCHCGAWNVRATDKCAECGVRLRRRRIDPEDPAFNGLTLPSGVNSASSRSADLGVVLMLIAVLALIFIGVPVCMQLQADLNARQSDLQQAVDQRREDEIQAQRLWQQSRQRQQPESPFQKWIHTPTR
jgi:hypothetical protein